jgi:hypothetical protein
MKAKGKKQKAEKDNLTHLTYFYVCLNYYSIVNLHKTKIFCICCFTIVTSAQDIAAPTG